MLKLLSITMFPIYLISWILSNILKLKNREDMPTPLEFLQAGFENPQEKYSL